MNRDEPDKRLSARTDKAGRVVLALPRCTFGVESHGGRETDPLAYGLFKEHPELRDGQIYIGDKPGFGLEPDWAFVERYRA